MNFKNIPVDIKSKSIEEAQKEVSEIIEILEKEENLENSIKKYHRLIFLNNYIEQKFRDKSKNISKKILKTYKIPYQKINFLCQDFKIKSDK